MPFQTCFTILICLMLGISGCMKAAAPMPSPPPAERAPLPQVETKRPHDSEPPAEDLNRLHRTPADVDDH